MTRADLHDEWLIAHRELQELRAIARAGSRKWVSASEQASRQRYAAERWRKSGAARAEVARRRGRGAATGAAAPSPSAPDRGQQDSAKSLQKA